MKIGNRFGEFSYEIFKQHAQEQLVHLPTILAHFAKLIWLFVQRMVYLLGYCNLYTEK